MYPEERPFWNLAQSVPGSAGFFIDTVSRNVIVSLTDVRQAAPARAALRKSLARELAQARASHPGADVVSRLVAYTFLQLKEWRDKLNSEVFTVPGVVWLDLDEVRNRVVIGLERSTDLAGLRRLAGELGVPEPALDFEEDGPAVPEGALRDQIRPIAGGTRLQSRPAGTTVTCTLGFPALWNGSKAFVTASHCSSTTFAVDGTQQYQPTVPLTHADSLTTTPIGSEVADYSEPCPPKLGTACAFADASIYQFSGTASQWVLGRIARPTYGCSPGPCNPVNLQIGGNFTILGTDSSLVVGDLVSMIGSGSGWSQAYVQKTCTNVKLGPGVAECQEYGNYGNGAGDSGAPILLDINVFPDTNVVLGGIHWGKTGQYAVFSPWSGIARDYPGLDVKARAAVPITAPDSVPNWLRASSLWVSNPARVTDPFVRDLVVVRFIAGATQAQRQDAIDLISGTVVGGVPFEGMEGAYYVQLPADSTNENVFSAIAALRGLGQVEDALPDLVSSDEFVYLRPNDGPGMQRADWHVNPDSAFGQPGRRTWAFEAVNAPYGWGCSVGDSAVRVAVVDGGLRRAGGIAPNVVDTSGMSTGSFRHGTQVASVLAARGNDSAGTTGMMWKAGLLLYSNERRDSTGAVFLRNGAPIPDEVATAAQIARALAHGARVINISVGVNTTRTGPHTAAQDSTRAYVGRLFRNAVVNSGTARPVIVLAAGNAGNATDVYWSSFAAVVDYLPNETLIVTGADLTAGLLAGFSVTGSAVSIAAPAVDVAADSGSGQAILVRGTSYAAPLVAGAAGLLLSFDPSLPAARVKQLIDSGAIRGGRTAGQYRLLNVYESLRLAARRPGAPLCGNRVWAANNTLVTERDPVAHTSETVVNLGEPGAGANVRHGGHRIEVSTQNGAQTRAFELRQGQWVETPDTATTAYGGTFLSVFARSHDLDSLATFRYWQPDCYDGNCSSAAFEVNVYDYATQTQTTIDTLVVPTAHSTTGVCTVADYYGLCWGQAWTGTRERVVAQLVFPPVGGRLLLALTYLATRDVALGSWETCPQPDTLPNGYSSCRSISYEDRTERAEFWGVDLRSRQAMHLWDVTDGVYWFGVSEDGAQLASGEGLYSAAWTDFGRERTWSDPGTIAGCAIRYHRMTDNTEVAPAIATADACYSYNPGQGTVAPAPPRASSP